MKFGVRYFLIQTYKHPKFQQNRRCLAKEGCELTWNVPAIRNEDEEGQAEVVWTCHEERPGVCKKDDENGVIGKEKKREV